MIRRDIYIDTHRWTLPEPKIPVWTWSDIPVPAYTMAFPDEVIDRLFALNAERAAEERVKGQGKAKASKTKPATRKKKAAPPSLPHVEGPPDDAIPMRKDRP
jgi:hypothetical protein